MCAFTLHRVTHLLFIINLLWHQLIFTNALISKNKLKSIPQNSIPFIVAFLYNRPEKTVEENQFCVGSIIAPKFVLTAAHCVEDMQVDQIKILVGSVDLHYGQTYDVEFRMSYENWILSLNRLPKYDRNDIAVVKLTKEVNLPVKGGIFSKNPTDYFRGKSVLAVGWGVSSCFWGKRRLRQAPMKIASAEEMDEITWIEPKEYMFASRGSPLALTEAGDSGGPLLKQVGTSSTYMIIGVTYGSGPRWFNTDDFRRMVAHTSIDPYRDFIDFVTTHYNY